MKPRILLIEDEADAVTVYRTQLINDGFDVDSATSAEDGLKLAQNIPALILLDLMLPGKMSGFDLMDMLKKNPRTKNIPILALTNLAEEVGFERAVYHGAENYIVKAERTPRQVSQLVSHIISESTQNKD